MKTIYLEPNQVPENLRYSGRKYKADISDTVTLHNTYWSGGTRSTYSAVDLNTGQKVSIATDSAPVIFGLDYDGQQITLKPGYAIIEHSMFCGKDMGLTFHIHPDNAGKFLPSPNTDLSESELCLLDATAGLKGSYGGRKPRIDMMRFNGFSDIDIDTAKTLLIEKGLLRKNGAITPAGRNASPNTFKSY